MPQQESALTRFYSALDSHQSSSRRWALFFIILIGFLLRWYSLFVGHAYTFFTIKDEISALRYAFGFMAGDPSMLYLGQPALNQGHIPGPLWAMFVSALYKLGGNSIEGAIFIMVLLNTLVIYLVYLLAKRMMPPRYALFSALFYALSPWAIFYSAGLYNPMALALLGVLLYLALWQTLTTDRSRAIFWVMVLAAAIPQIHMIGIFYYPAILLLLVLSTSRINCRWLAAGIAAGVILYVPYLIGEITHGWSNLRHVLQGNNKFSFGILKVITIPIGMLTNHPGKWTGYTIQELLAFGNRWFGSYLVLIGINLISFILALLFFGRFFRKTYSTLRSSDFKLRSAFMREPRYLMIGILLVVPLLLYLFTGKDYATRYSILIFPILFLLPALYLIEVKNRRFKLILHTSIAVMFICNIYIVLSFYADLNRQLNHSTRFMPAFYKLEALDHALRKYAGKDKIIKVDTTNLIDKDNKYWDITTNAISRFISLNQSSLLKQKHTKGTEKFDLVDKKSKVPPNAKIVYRDNGLIAYLK